MRSHNTQEICLNYLATLDNKQTISDTKNALIRYFVPSLGGPRVSAAKRRPVIAQEADKAFEFLKHVCLEQLANAPDWALKTIEELNSSVPQKERVRSDLRNLVDWARKEGYLPPPHNPVPKGICNYIELGRFSELNLKPATSLDICNEYLKQLDDREAYNDVRNGIIRYFVPATDGPLPFHKPPLDVEVKAAFKHLERVPLEYLQEAASIVTPVFKALDISQTQQTRVRSALRDLIDWARDQRYLPHPNSIAPWGGEYKPTPLGDSLFEEESQSILDIYKNYCSYLQSKGKHQEILALQSTIIKYFVPACGGTASKGKRASPTEIQAGIDYLQQISIKQLCDGVKLVEAQFDLLSIEVDKYYTQRSKLKAWIDWAKSEGYFSQIEVPQKRQPVFNTFYKNGVRRQRKKPGIELHKKRCSVHKLCAKQFPDDYINPDLQRQIEAYKAWRLSNDVRTGAIATEEEQILQILGWLYRYENIPLDKLFFECLITKSQLLFWIQDYESFPDYEYAKQAGIQKARKQADIDIERVQRYLNFIGDQPSSQKKRVSLIIAISKFIYKDLIGSDDFPEAKNIPVIRRLLQIQIELGKKAKSVSKSVSYHETCVSWSKAIMAMEKQRRRAEQVIIDVKTELGSRGYREQRRPETAIANDLQKFLSIAFCILVPSRSRTFYDLRIGETFKEGILTETGFFSVEELKNQENWEESKNSVRFYIHHNAQDYKTGKSMAPVLLNNGGWWVELPNIKFSDKCFYDYIYRWLEWGRYAEGTMSHNFFFRLTSSTKPLNYSAWGSRIRTIFARWTEVAVPPNNIRKMFASEFPEHKESAALLLQHSEQIHNTNYDMRHSWLKMESAVNANQEFIADVLTQL